jgi:hypothetical protein
MQYQLAPYLDTKRDGVMYKNSATVALLTPWLCFKFAKKGYDVAL